MIDMCSLTQSEIAKKMGVSQSYVANKLRLLNFSDYLQLLILDAKLTERHARLLLRLKGEAEIKAAIEKIKLMKLSVAASEALVDSMMLDGMAKNISKNSTRDSIIHFERLISESLKNLTANGVSVKQRTHNHSGKKYITLCIDEG